MGSHSSKTLNSSVLRQTNIMGAKCSCGCFGSAMEAKTSKAVCKSESLWLRFKRRIKQERKNQSSKPAASSNYAVQISPTCLISGKSKASVRIVSISQGGEFVPVILSPVGKALSNERQPTEQKTPVGQDAVEIKDEVCPEEEGEATAQKSDHRSRIGVAKAFQFPKAPAFHRNGPKVSQDPIRRCDAEDTKTPMIEQPREQEIQKKKEIADSIPAPIKYISKSSGTFAAVGSKTSKLWKFINFHRNLSSHGSKRRGIKSATLSQLPRPGMNSSTRNFQPKKVNMLAERKRTITGDATSEGEGYSMSINLSILIIIMACLVVFSNRLLAVVCTSIWWYLFPILLRK